MSRDMITGILYGINISTLITALYTQWLIRRTKCIQCKKRYWQNKSTSKHQVIFCSQACEDINSMEYLLKSGCPPQIATSIITRQKGGNA
jgi:hypothetical protein